MIYLLVALIILLVPYKDLIDIDKMQIRLDICINRQRFPHKDKHLKYWE